MAIKKSELYTSLWKSCDDALRLGRILAGLMPGEPEVTSLWR